MGDLFTFQKNRIGQSILIAPESPNTAERRNLLNFNNPFAKTESFEFGLFFPKKRKPSLIFKIYSFLKSKLICLKTWIRQSDQKNKRAFLSERQIERLRITLSAGVRNLLDQRLECAIVRGKSIDTIEETENQRSASIKLCLIASGRLG